VSDFDDLLDDVLPDTKPVKAEPKKRGVRKRKSGDEGEGSPVLNDESGTRARCSAYAPRGTKCKFCGKVHPL
jgi:hypothetical protein